MGRVNPRPLYHWLGDRLVTDPDGDCLCVVVVDCVVVAIADVVFFAISVSCVFVREVGDDVAMEGVHFKFLIIPIR